MWLGNQICTAGWRKRKPNVMPRQSLSTTKRIGNRKEIWTWLISDRAIDQKKSFQFLYCSFDGSDCHHLWSRNFSHKTRSPSRRNRTLSLVGSSKCDRIAYKSTNNRTLSRQQEMASWYFLSCHNLGIKSFAILFRQNGQLISCYEPVTRLGKEERRKVRPLWAAITDRPYVRPYKLHDDRNLNGKLWLLLDRCLLTIQR